jgi:hypothetical protein
MTSARSAGATSSECLSTLPALKTVGSVTQVVGCAGMTLGAGRNPPSLPIWIQSGPSVPTTGVGNTPAGSVSAAATSSGLRATSVQATPVLSTTGAVFDVSQGFPSASIAWYIDRLKNRSLAALRIRKR